MSRSSSERTAGAGLLPPIVLDPGASTSLQGQLVASLRAAVLAGTLPPGRRLPSTRSLAGDLELSRNTVLYAYEQLEAEGYLRARRGSGTYVATGLERVATSPAGPAATRPPRLARRTARTASVGSISVAQAGELWPFMVGVPDLAAFPRRTWARLMGRRLGEGQEALLGYGDSQGLAELRRAIAEYLGSSRGVRCDPEQVLVVHGSQQALDLIGRVLLDPGDAVWMEEPGYRGARGAFLAAGAEIVPVPLDRQGIDLDAAPKDAPAPRAIFVTPSNQFPTGITTSLARRLALLECARNFDAWVVEDDYDSEFRYEGAPIPALQGLDEDGRVLYVGTFSKTLVPAVRVGFLVLPKNLVAPFVTARAHTDQHTASLPQAVLADFLREGHYARQVARMRRRYGQRRRRLMALLRSEVPELQIWPARGGMHLVVELPEGVDDGELFERLERRRVQALPLSAFHHGPPGTAGLLLGYAAFDEAETRRGVAVLREELRALL